MLNSVHTLEASAEAPSQEFPGANHGDRCAGEGVGIQPRPAPSSPAFLTLPAPPSVNAAFRNTAKGRARTKLYDDWLGHAGWRLREQSPGVFPGPVVILIGIERINAFADIDNRIKPTLDLLVGQKVIDDDRQVIGVAAAWNPPRDGLMRLAIIPAADFAVSFHLASDGRAGGWFWNAPETEEAA